MARHPGRDPVPGRARADDPGPDGRGWFRRVVAPAILGDGHRQALVTDTDEDCLYLNVWTPDPAGRRPVIVWVYGGGFDVGSAAPPMTDGAALCRLTGAVVVAANYRVGALGYLHLADIGGPA